MTNPSKIPDKTADKIPYTYPMPIPSYFENHDWFTENSCGYNNSQFIFWVLRRTYVFENFKKHKGRLIHLSSWEFIYSHLKCQKGTGLSEREVRNRIQRLMDEGFIIKNNEKSEKDFSVYTWLPVNFCKNDKSKGQDLLGEEINAKGQDEHPKGQDKSQGKGQDLLGEEINAKGQDKGQGKGQAYLKDSKRSSKEEQLDKGSKSTIDLAQTDSQHLQLFDKTAFTAFSTAFDFNPKTYMLKNGESLSAWTQNAFAKYQGDEFVKLISNVSYYEKRYSEGATMPNHERYLRKCVKFDYAKNKMNAHLNTLFVKDYCNKHNITYIIMSVVNIKELKKPKNDTIELLKTKVRFLKRNTETEVISLDLEQPPLVFSSIWENNRFSLPFNV